MVYKVSMAGEFAQFKGTELTNPGDYIGASFRTLPKAMKLMSKMGYGAIEYAPFTSGKPLDDDSGMDERSKFVKQAVDDGYGVISGLHWIMSFLKALNPPRDLSLFAEKSELDDARGYYYRIIDYCKRLGGTCVVHGSPPSREMPDGMGLTTGMQRVRDFYTEIGKIHRDKLSVVDYAEKQGIDIAFEPLGKKETNFVNTAQQGLDLVELVKHSNFKITLDVKAMYQEGQDADPNKTVSEIIRAVPVDKVGAVHLNDPYLTGPGLGKWGEPEFVEVLSAFRDIGWGVDRYLTVEPFKKVGDTTIDDCDKIIKFLNPILEQVFGKG